MYPGLKIHLQKIGAERRSDQICVFTELFIIAENL